MVRTCHCVKSIRIRSFSGPYFPAFGLNAERYSVSLRIYSECGEIRTRKTPNTDTFNAVCSFPIDVLYYGPEMLILLNSRPKRSPILIFS